MTALPAQVTYVTVIGKLLKADGAPLQGQLMFSPEIGKRGYSGALAGGGRLVVTSATPPIVVVVDPVPVTLAVDGSFSVSLVATDNPNIAPTGWTWTVSFALGSATIPPFSFAGPAGTTVDLAVVAPIAVNTGSAVVIGPAGPTGATGAPGPQGPVMTDAQLAVAVDTGATKTKLGSTYALPLITTPVKTAAYTATANQLIPVDATTAPVTVTLPTAPAAATRVTVKKIDASVNLVTVASAGGDVFNVVGGVTTKTLTMLNQAASYQYSAGIWYAVSDDIPLSGLDARFLTPAAASSTYGRPAPAATVPLVIPTYDGNPDCGHPSVVYYPAGFGGYRYWMAFTPYPTGARENPSVVASQDGVTWVVPAGLTNPVVPLAETNADGYDYNSDTHLTKLPNGSLAMWCRGGKTSNTSNALFRRTSTDGVTWGNKTKVLEDLTLETSMLSPAFEYGLDGTTMYMWVVWRSSTVIASSTGRIDRYTSTDNGLTWGSKTSCTYPAWLNPWHLDVKVAGGQYHLLCAALNNNGASDTLQYLTSVDGLAWTGDSAPSVVPDGLAWDQAFYRSAFLPVPGDALAWDIYATGTPAGVAHDSPWRIGLLKGVTLPTRRAINNQLSIAQDRNLAALGSTPFVVGDGFNRADSATVVGTCITGQVWTLASGTPGIAGGKFYSPGALSRIVVESGLADCEVSADFTAIAASADGYIMLRYVDGSNWWRIGVYNGLPTGSVTFQKFVAGALTTTLTDTTRVLRPGDRLRVVAAGSTITAYRNFDLIRSITDGFNATATQHGLQLAPGYRVDNFGVKPLP